MTVALVEADAQRQFIAWHTITTQLTSAGWQIVGRDAIQLAPTAAFVSVSCYLEPGAPGDEAHIDDIVVREIR